MRGLLLAAILLLGGASSAAAADPVAGWKLPKKFAELSAAERDALFTAAGFTREGAAWKGCGGSSDPFLDEGWIDGGAIRDLNGDGRPEVFVGDGSSACYGMTGQGYVLLAATPSGWKVIDQGGGIPTVLTTRGPSGWLDIEIGGPGFCFPVLRWNGSAYVPHRNQYDGKPCKPN